MSTPVAVAAFRFSELTIDGVVVTILTKTGLSLQFFRNPAGRDAWCTSDSSVIVFRLRFCCAALSARAPSSNAFWKVRSFSANRRYWSIPSFMLHTKRSRNMMSLGSVVNLGDTDNSPHPNDAAGYPPEAAAPTAEVATGAVTPKLQSVASFLRAAT